MPSTERSSNAISDNSWTTSLIGATSVRAQEAHKPGGLNKVAHDVSSTAKKAGRDTKAEVKRDEVKTHAGLQNAGNTLQGADFPSGLVGVMQGIILFSALGGELLVRYRVRFGGAPTAEPAA